MSIQHTLELFERFVIAQEGQTAALKKLNESLLAKVAEEVAQTTKAFAPPETIKNAADLPRPINYEEMTRDEVIALCEKRGIAVRAEGASKDSPTKTLINKLNSWDTVRAATVEAAMCEEEEATAEEAPVEEEAVAEEPDPFETEDTPPPTTTLTYEAFQSAAQQARKSYIESGGGEAKAGQIILGVFSKYGAKRISEIAEKDRVAVIDALNVAFKEA